MNWSCAEVFVIHAEFLREEKDVQRALLHLHADVARVVRVSQLAGQLRQADAVALFARAGDLHMEDGRRMPRGQIDLL